MSNWYTADTHFGSDSNDNDTIYVIGDFCNYNHHEKDYESGLAVSKLVNAHIVYIIGNSEERVINDHFGGDFNRFRDYCLMNPGFKFDDVLKNTYLDINGIRFFLTHRPVNHDKDCLNLFGHVHRGIGLWRPFGFNVGTDLNHFQLFGDDDIMFLMKQKKEYWDIDPDINC